MEWIEPGVKAVYNWLATSVGFPLSLQLNEASSSANWLNFSKWSIMLRQHTGPSGLNISMIPWAGLWLSLNVQYWVVKWWSIITSFSYLDHFNQRNGVFTVLHICPWESEVTRKPGSYGQVNLSSSVCSPELSAKLGITSPRTTFDNKSCKNAPLIIPLGQVAGRPSYFWDTPCWLVNRSGVASLGFSLSSMRRRRRRRRQVVSLFLPSSLLIAARSFLAYALARLPVPRLRSKERRRHTVILRRSRNSPCCRDDIRERTRRCQLQGSRSKIN